MVLGTVCFFRTSQGTIMHTAATSNLGAHFCTGRRLLLAWLANEPYFQEHAKRFERRVLDAARKHPAIHSHDDVSAFAERHCFELVGSLPTRVVLRQVRRANTRDRHYRLLRPHLAAIIEYAESVGLNANSLSYLMRLGDRDTGHWDPAEARQAHWALETAFARFQIDGLMPKRAAAMA